MPTSSILNKIIYGRSENKIPKYIEDNSIDLIYADPPYNSQRDFNFPNGIELASLEEKNAYKDKWFNGNDSYTKAMNKIFSECHRILKNGGILITQCDDNAFNDLINILKNIFLTSKGEMIETIFWKRKSNRDNSATTKHGRTVDLLLVFRKGIKQHTFNRQFMILTQDELKKEFPYIEKETNRKYKLCPLEMHDPSNMGTKRIFGDKTYITKIGWKWTQKTINERLKNNPYLIAWSKNGKPKYKTYEDEYEGKSISNLWLDINGLSPNSKERKSMNFPTQKPILLLERIIKTYSNENDIILDPFLGSGTTIIAAINLKRNWIGIEENKDSIRKSYERIIGDKLYKENIIDYPLSSIEIDNMSGFDYQKFTIEEMGGRLNSPLTNDKGIDGFFLDGTIIQCKNSKIGTPVVREVAGRLNTETVNFIKKAVIVGKEFSNDARASRNEQKQSKDYNIIFITTQEIKNGDFKKILSDNNILTLYDYIEDKTEQKRIIPKKTLMEYIQKY